MTAALAKSVPQTIDYAALLADLGARAKAASHALEAAGPERRKASLVAAAQALRDATPEILAANARDLARAKNLSAPLVDRLRLDEKRVASIADAVLEVAELPDPLGHVTESWTRPNGLKFERVTVPLGVIGIIYESRPNVTADAAALCIKSGNAVILRGGSDSFDSSAAILKAMRAGLAAAGLPEDAVQAPGTPDRGAVEAMLKAADWIDVIIPRGGKSLISFVADTSRIPVLKHLDGNCHIYVHPSAKPDLAMSVIRNAKLRRQSVCGAVESLLFDQKVLETMGRPVLAMLLDAGCAVRGDAEIRKLDPRIEAATEEDWSTEYLDMIVSAAVVDGVDAAIDHVNRYGSHHTDAILAEDATAAEAFLNGVDSAIVLVNASTQFADGGEFGFGAEIGISTGKLHARGPVGAQHLVSYKYRVRGSGQVRP